MAPEDESSGEPATDQSDLEKISRAIMATDPAWEAGKTLRLGKQAWEPHLQRKKPQAILHIHLADRLRSYVLTRMAAAYSAGHEVHVAIPLSALYHEDLLRLLTDLDAIIHIINPDNSVDGPIPLLSCLAARQVRLSPEARTALATRGWMLSQEHVSKQKRGRRFEAALFFLLSQVEDFVVIKRNLRTDTEELDAVVQQRATQGRCWATIGAPFILVEAKNWVAKVTQNEVSAFRTKMQGRRGTVRIGLVFAANGFTSDARDQELRFASQDLTIALIGPDEIQNWINAAKGDDYLEDLVQVAMLR